VTISRRMPSYYVKIGNTLLHDVRSLTNPGLVSLAHTELGNGGTELKITIPNAKYDLLDAPDFQEGVAVEWSFGYAPDPDAPSAFSRRFSGKVYTVDPVFDAYAGLVIMLYAYNEVAELTARQRRHVWEGAGGVTESDVVAQIAEDLNLRVVVEPTDTRYEAGLGQNSTDWDYLQELARTAVARDPSRRGPYRVWIEEDTLYFMPPTINAPAQVRYEFMTERRDPALLMFRPRIEIKKPGGDGATEVAAEDVGPDGETVDATVDNETAERTGTTDSTYVVQDVEENTGELDQRVTGHQTEDPDGSNNADARASNELARQELNNITADISVVGDPRIKANDVIAILNVGAKFSGNYLVDELTHTINDGGYITTIIGKKSGVPANTNDYDESGALTTPAEGDPTYQFNTYGTTGEIERVPSRGSAASPTIGPPAQSPTPQVGLGSTLAIEAPNETSDDDAYIRWFTSPTFADDEMLAIRINRWSNGYVRYTRLLQLIDDPMIIDPLLSTLTNLRDNYYVTLGMGAYHEAMTAGQ
jgi:hypothetical protein